MKSWKNFLHILILRNIMRSLQIVIDSECQLTSCRFYLVRNTTHAINPLSAISQNKNKSSFRVNALVLA